MRTILFVLVFVGNMLGSVAPTASHTLDEDITIVRVDQYVGATFKVTFGATGSREHLLVDTWDEGCKCMEAPIKGAAVLRTGIDHATQKPYTDLLQDKVWTIFGREPDWR